MLKPQREQKHTAAEIANAANQSAELSADELRAISGGATGNPPFRFAGPHTHRRRPRQPGSVVGGAHL